MRPVHVLAVIGVLVICCSICASGYQIALQDTELRNDVQSVDLFRQKRQVETFDDDDKDMSAAQQEDFEETGFWDRVVRVAIKIFARFVEWLNS